VANLEATVADLGADRAEAWAAHDRACDAYWKQRQEIDDLRAMLAEAWLQEGFRHADLIDTRNELQAWRDGSS
jgi:hypothetical protein